MNLSNNGLELIKEFEGLRLQAYQCVAGKWTIGYGHCGSDVVAGMQITIARAEELLRQDVVKFELAVNLQVKVPLTQNQFDALVSWCYNLGEKNLRTSTMLTRLNTGDYAAVPAEMQRWDKAGGKVMLGLTRRRGREAELFAQPDVADIGLAGVASFRVSLRM